MSVTIQPSEAASKIEAASARNRRAEGSEVQERRRPMAAAGVIRALVAVFSSAEIRSKRQEVGGSLARAQSYLVISELWGKARTKRAERRITDPGMVLRVVAPAARPLEVKEPNR